MVRPLLLLLALCGAAAAARDLLDVALPADVDLDDPREWRAEPRVGKQALVQFKRGATPTDKARALGRGGAVKQETVGRGGGGGELVLARFPSPPGVHRSTAKAAKEVESDESVEFVEPNFIYTHQALANDPYVLDGRLWGMGGGAGCRAAAAWAADQVGSREVLVGVIDEGIMQPHPDLQPNVGANPGEIPGNGIDDDGNGKVDDVFGWDFIDNDASVFNGMSDDHGTHVAGTVGAVGGNGKGVAGVAWNVRLLSGRFLGSTGGTTANAIKAIDYFTDLKKRQNLTSLIATTNSWGGGGYSQALRDSIQRAGDADILFIAAAGNDGTDNDVTGATGAGFYPATYGLANIISVASITSTGALSSFSNYGATTVDLGAPGSGIWSTVPAEVATTSGKGRKAVTTYTIVPSYASYSGTSMATPHVTGAAALYASKYMAENGGKVPTGAQIKAAILGSVEPTPSLAGKCVTGGRLNVARLLGLE